MSAPLVQSLIWHFSPAGIRFFGLGKFKLTRMSPETASSTRPTMAAFIAQDITCLFLLDSSDKALTIKD